MGDHDDHGQGEAQPLVIDCRGGLTIPVPGAGEGGDGGE